MRGTACSSISSSQQHLVQSKNYESHNFPQPSVLLLPQFNPDVLISVLFSDAYRPCFPKFKFYTLKKTSKIQFYFLIFWSQSGPK
jgi:hypothetical protein